MHRSPTAPLVLFVAGLFAGGLSAADPPAGYKLWKTVAVAGDGGWDYLCVDEAGRRVYVSHGNGVEVLDADSGEVKGQVADTAGVHGIAVAPALGRGFTSNGRADTVSVFDLKTLKTLDTVATGKNPDAILYDPSSKRVFAFNGGGASATVIDAATAKVAGTIKLGGQPESAVADGAGHVYVNLEDKDEVLKIDADKLKVVERWAVAKTPVSLAIDTKSGRLFVGCRSKSLVVVSTETGKTVATVAIGEGVDAGAFDPETRTAFCSCGDGTVAVVRQESADKYTLTETLATRTRSRTMALDPKTHRLFLPTAEFKAPADQPKARPVMVPKSFAVLIYAKDGGK